MVGNLASRDNGTQGKMCLLQNQYCEDALTCRRCKRPIDRLCVHTF